MELYSHNKIAYDSLISECGFSKRLLNCLKSKNIHTVKLLFEVDMAKLKRVRNFGAGCQKEV
jgi:DNA-directed RNA polymerase alpha subunit